MALTDRIEDSVIRDNLPLNLSVATPVTIQNQILNAASLDASNRLRVSQQLTQGDYRQTNDKLPYFFDEVVVDSATAVYENDKGGVKMSVDANTDYAIRQTFQTHNYASGKSQLIEITFAHMAPEFGIIKRQGYYQSSLIAPYTDNLDGFFIETEGTTVRLRVVKNGVDKLNVTQANWNIDKLNGAGPSGVFMNWNNFNVFVIDFLYLGGTQVRFGFLLDGQIQWVHYFSHANNFDSTIVLQPSLPIRCEIRGTDNFDSLGFMYQICAQVSTEGAIGEVGRIRSFDMNTTSVNAQSVGVMYPLIGLRLKEAYRNITINPISYSAIATTNDNFLIRLVINPTIVGTAPVWTDGGQGALEVARFSGNGSTATGGDQGSAKYALASQGIQGIENNARRIGMSIDGVPDQIFLCAIPLTVNSQIFAAIQTRELI